MDLESPFDPDLFSPDYVAQVKGQRAALGKAIPKDLDFKVQPVPAQVFVDGTFRGISSLEMHDLVPGEHVVTAIAPGYRRVQRMVTPGTASAALETLEPTALNAQLEPLLQALRGKFLANDRNAAAQALAKFFRADQVAVLGVRSLGGESFRVTGLRIAAADGHEYANIEEAFPNDEWQFAPLAKNLLGRMLSADLPRGKGGQAIQARVNPFRWQKRHTSYVLFGVAAAALGSGITFGVNARQQSSAYADLDAPQTNPVYDRIETVGKRSAILSDVSFGIALAAAATGTVLLIRDLMKKDFAAGPEIGARTSVSQAALSPVVDVSDAEGPVADEGRAHGDRAAPPDEAETEAGTEDSGRSTDDSWSDGW